ncbi:MAG: hypothetical protein WBD20_17285 [Pirellulaceae bacterium]
MDVPIHVWQPPALESTVGKKVVLSEVAGPKETANLLREKMLSGVPHDAGRQTVLSPTGTLSQNEAIQLVSATDQAPSDIALRAAATQEGYDYVLRGEVLADRRAKHLQADDERLTVSWRLMPLDQSDAGIETNDHAPTGAPIVVDRQSAIERYPDLALLSDDESILTTAAVRDTYGLITPSIDRADVDLAIPYLMLGSAKIRQGNMAALAGRWGDAKQIWTEVAKKHPLQVAAIHNLALAAAAEQDFSTAKQLARKAIRRAPTKLHKQTAQWIEQRQREYHQSFNLPDPPEGWYLTQ